MGLLGEYERNLGALSHAHHKSDVQGRHLWDIGIFIMAAGASSRTGGYPKQLFTLDGETIIGRTIRLVREVHPDVPIHVVSWRKELRLPGCEYINTHHATPSLAYSMLLTQYYWRSINYFLLGDVIYTPEIIREIFNAKKLTVFGSERCFKGYSERYAMIFAKNEKDKIVGVLWWAASFLSGEMKAISMGFSLWRRMIYRLHYTFKNYFGVFGYFAWHILPMDALWVLPGISRLVQDEKVVDIDTLPEYFDYCLSFSSLPDTSLVFQYGEQVLGMKRVPVP